MRLSVQAASLAVRCGWCHADDAPVVPCAGCGATLHVECRAESLRCPTLGCSGLAGSMPPPTREVPWGLLLWLQVLTVLWLELVALGPLIRGLRPREQPLSPAALALVSVGLNARSALGAAVWSLGALGGVVGWRRGLRAAVVVATGVLVGIGVAAACLATGAVRTSFRF